MIHFKDTVKLSKYQQGLLLIVESMLEFAKSEQGISAQRSFGEAHYRKMFSTFQFTGLRGQGNTEFAKMLGQLIDKSVMLVTDSHNPDVHEGTTVISYNQLRQTSVSAVKTEVLVFDTRHRKLSYENTNAMETMKMCFGGELILVID